jgi:hypothetical protein
MAGSSDSATGQWVEHLEWPPSEIAHRRWEQAKAAASAGAAAWRNSPPEQVAGVAGGAGGVGAHAGGTHTSGGLLVHLLLSVPALAIVLLSLYWARSHVPEGG